MKTIYAVNSGSYSDYHIIALFSTKEKAEEFMRLIPDVDYNEIEEYELDPKTTDMVKRGYSIWQVFMLRDGTIERLSKREKIDSYEVRSIGHWIWERTKAPAYKGKGIPDVLNSVVWAKTEKEAIKIVNEHRAQMIANDQW